MKKFLLVLCFALVPVLGSAQTLTLADRATLGNDGTFKNRVKIAAIQTALTVASEDAGTPDHAARVRLAAWTLTEPEVVAQRLAFMAASVNSVDNSTTDTALKTLLTNNWTLIAQLFMANNR